MAVYLGGTFHDTQRDKHIKNIEKHGQRLKAVLISEQVSQWDH